MRKQWIQWQSLLSWAPKSLWMMTGAMKLKDACSLEFMIWATVSSVLFCWLYRAAPSLAAKNIINLISVLTIWWCPCVESSLVLLKRVFAMISMFSWQNFVSLCPSSFCIPRPNLPITPGISWLPTFAFQSLIMKRIFEVSQKEKHQYSILKHIYGI